MATEDMWVTVRPGDPFPEQQKCIRALGVPGLDQEAVSHPDSYIALWLRPDGEAVCGTAWNEGGIVKARFTWDGKQFTGEETNGFRILKYCEHDSDKYHWVRAKEANEHALLYIGEYVPAVVVCGKDAAIGKANWQRKMVWTCENNCESCHQDEEFSNCFLLAKE
uniref:Uncharacterized protein n=1 Tax=Plectus sambesii TaxID=2011161 RepID=A0A914WIB3_9BILA